VGCRYSTATGLGHWVVYDPRKKKLLDPLKSSVLDGLDPTLDRRYRPYSRLIIA
jgi:hypothetical protein